MIGNSIPEYLFIRASIAALRLITPSSILYLAASIYSLSFPISPLIGVLATAEACFYLVVYLPRKRRLQAACPPTYSPLQLTRSQRQELFDKCRTDLQLGPGIEDGGPYPRGWFLPTGQALRQQDVINWLLWSLFSCEPQDAKMDEWKEEIEGYVKVVEGLLGENLDEGAEGNVVSMRLTSDPVKVTHRPLIWYSIVCLVDTLTTLRLMYLGFKHYSSTRKWFQTFPPRPILSVCSHNADLSPDILLSYWYRPHKSKTKLPVLFLHGIGIGLYPYLPLVRELIAQDPDIGILLIELLPISMHMTAHPIAPRPLLIKALNNILNTLEIHRIVLAAHSYGTFISACILRPPSAFEPTNADDYQAHSALLSKISHVLFVDPIPILLHLPPVAYNFLYRRPSAAAEWQLWYFASTDPDVARTLGRAMFWQEGIMWKEDLAAFMKGGDSYDSPGHDGPPIPYHINDPESGRNSQKTNQDALLRVNQPPNGSPRDRHVRQRGRNFAVVLSGKDQIVPAESVRRYLTGEMQPCAHWIRRGWAWAMPSMSLEPLIVYNSDDNGEINGEGGAQNVGGDLEVLFYPGLDHATVFDTRERREGMIDVFHRFIRGVE